MFQLLTCGRDRSLCYEKLRSCEAKTSNGYDVHAGARADSIALEPGVVSSLIDEPVAGLAARASIPPALNPPTGWPSADPTARSYCSNRLRHCIRGAQRLAQAFSEANERTNAVQANLTHCKEAISLASTPFLAMAPAAAAAAAKGAENGLLNANVTSGSHGPVVQPPAYWKTQLGRCREQKNEAEEEVTLLLNQLNECRGGRRGEAMVKTVTETVTVSATASATPTET